MTRFKLVSFLFTFCLAALLPKLDAANGDTVRYYRHLLYNHNTPNIDYIGTYEISKDEAGRVEHYEFVYGGNGKLAEIFNCSSESWRNHALTHLGAYRTVYAYEGNRETRTFFDKDGKRVMNLRQVYSEVYTYGSVGEKVSLEFFDLGGKPMESNWHIARYTWQKERDTVYERRFNLKGELVPLSPYFNFHISAIKYDKNGYFMEHDNLDDELNPVPNDKGIACYKDVFAANGNHLGISYYDAKGDLVNNHWGFAISRLTYDDKGNVSSHEFVDKDGKVMMRSTFSYDETGKLIPPEKN